eukprot:TRINITY_DN2094_c0_g1_i1.p1 TRINITY_DN2094_c0_g1~~TRINITY_DN2094_c0_g1_i1.p1  ORF type:complete len:173 (+),score=16.33 TRINITY_DN2094_c0_g1_i1:76-594(+)
MFFMIERTEQISLHPAFFGGNIQQTILKQLRNKVEGHCSGRYGYTISVISLQSYDRGKLDTDTGNAVFHVRYHSLVFRPFRNEILPAEVTSISGNGFFCQAGPLEIFVSTKLMPSNFRYDTQEGLPAFASEDEEVKIQVGSLVRVKLVGVRLAAEDISCIGTIKEDYLGPIE